MIKRWQSMVDHGLASVLVVVCFVADYIFLSEWFMYNTDKTDRRFQLSLRSILIVITVASLQFFVLFAYIHGLKT